MTKRSDKKDSKIQELKTRLKMKKEVYTQNIRVLIREHHAHGIELERLLINERKEVDHLRMLYNKQMIQIEVLRKAYAEGYAFADAKITGGDCLDYVHVLNNDGSCKCGVVKEIAEVKSCTSM